MPRAVSRVPRSRTPCGPAAPPARLSARSHRACASAAARASPANMPAGGSAATTGPAPAASKVQPAHAAPRPRATMHGAALSMPLAEELPPEGVPASAPGRLQESVSARVARSTSQTNHVCALHGARCQALCAGRHRRACSVPVARRGCGRGRVGWGRAAGAEPCGRAPDGLNSGERPLNVAQGAHTGDAGPWARARAVGAAFRPCSHHLTPSRENKARREAPRVSSPLSNRCYPSDITFARAPPAPPQARCSAPRPAAGRPRAHAAWHAPLREHRSSAARGAGHGQRRQLHGAARAPGQRAREGRCHRAAAPAAPAGVRARIR